MTRCKRTTRPVDITLHGKSGTQYVRRVVWNVRQTGHVAKDWGGQSFRQWAGEIKYLHKVVKVWGYTDVSLDPEYHAPLEWANDTY